MRILFVVLLHTLIYANESRLPQVVHTIVGMEGKLSARISHDVVLLNDSVLYIAETGGIISKFELNPFRKIYSKQVVDYKVLKDFGFDEKEEIRELEISFDEKYAVVKLGRSYGDNKAIILIIDLNWNMITGKLPIAKYDRAIIMSKHGLLTMNRKRSVLKVWDIENLKEIKRKDNFMQEAYGCAGNPNLFLMISKDRQTLAAVNAHAIGLLDLNTFDVKNIYECMEKQMLTAYHPDYIYCEDDKYSINNGSAVRMTEEDMQYNLQRAWSKYTLKLSNGKTFSARVERKKSILNENKRYTVQYPQVRIYNFEKNKKVASLYSFEKGWLALTPDGYFDGSKNARDYLQVKEESGKLVPIDDETYNAYHKKIWIK